jgi:hypothetical protein
MSACFWTSERRGLFFSYGFAAILLPSDYEDYYPMSYS